MNLQDLFYRSCERYAERNALSFVSGEPLTYAQVKTDVERIIALLGRMGITKGDKVAVLGANMANWGIAYFAIVCAGAVAVPILPEFHPDEIRNIIEHSDSKAIIISNRFRPMIEHVIHPHLIRQVIMDDFSVVGGDLADHPSNIERTPVSGSDLASIIYTSGTTGRSKGVMLTHHNIASNAKACLQIQDVNENDVLLSILPLSHAYENTIGFILPFMQGASIYYLEKPPTANVLIPALQKIRPTIMLSVPLVIEKLYRNQVKARFVKTKWLKWMYEELIPFRKTVHYLAGRKLKAAFGGRLRFFGIGGAKVDAVVERFLYEARFPYAIGYGLTETAPLLAGSNPSQVALLAIGKVLDGVQVKINNPDHTGMGEILAKGDNVMAGYYKDAAMTQSVFTDDGWFCTGDLGCFDKHRRLVLKGRKKNMILGAAGENIYPEDIESIINNVKGVEESLVLEQKGKLVAMVHLNIEELEKQYQQVMSDAIQYYNERKEDIHQQMSDFLEEVKRYVNLHVNRFSQIQSVEIMPTPFEKTPTLKIKRYLYS
ncbi:MAG: AMP-binding protein [Bacteroidales bacterium]|nr:AMP-binding protein [Bacteroidales bacterium]